MDGRAREFRFPSEREASRPLIRASEPTVPCLILEGDRDFEGARDFTPLRLPGRGARALRASTAWGRALSTTGRIEGCSALRVTLSMRLSSPAPIRRRPISGDCR